LLGLFYFYTMCGRYVQVTSVQEISKRFGVTPAPQQPHPERNTNVAPGEAGWVITQDQPNLLQSFTFGFSPSWAKKRMYIINARSEGDFNAENRPDYTGKMGIFQKPMFRQAIRSQRCMVLADAFIEGPQTEKLKKPYCVYLRNKQRPFAFAGIWDEWKNPDSGEVHRSFAILTTAPNTVTQAIGHHRSPVILPFGEESAWLDPSCTPQDLMRWMHPYPGSAMNAYPIDPQIRNPRMNGLGLLNPIGERIFPETELAITSALELQGMGRRERPDEPPSEKEPSDC